MADKKQSDKDRRQPDTDSGQEQISREQAKYNQGGTPTRYTPGTNVGGIAPGGASAADVTGGRAGGDIDNPDITGRGSVEDLAGKPAARPRPIPQDRGQS